MVARVTSVIDQFPQIESSNDQSPRQQTLAAPAIAFRSQSPVIVYDREDDALLVFLAGRRDSVANQVDGEMFVLLDPDTDELVGFQFENVVARALRMNPALIELIELDGVEFRGATKADLQRAWRQQVPFQTRLLVRIRGLTDRLQFLRHGNSRMQIQLLVDEVMANAR